MCLKDEPASEALHMSVKKLFNRAKHRLVQLGDKGLVGWVLVFRISETIYEIVTFTAAKIHVDRSSGAQSHLQHIYGLPRLQTLRDGLSIWVSFESPNGTCGSADQKICELCSLNYIYGELERSQV